MKREGSISTPFDDFDERIDPFLKREYDHAMLINVNDPLYDALSVEIRNSGDTLKLKPFDSRPELVPSCFGLARDALVAVLHGVTPCGRVVCRLEAVTAAYNTVGHG